MKTIAKSKIKKEKSVEKPKIIIGSTTKLIGLKESYIDKVILKALDAAEIYYYIKHGKEYLQKNRIIMALPMKSEFLQKVSELFGIGMSKYIIEEKQKECFACNMSNNGKCMNRPHCGNPGGVLQIEEDKNYPIL